MAKTGPISPHIPVLLEAAVAALAVQPGGRYIDCTVGGGGHAEAILQRSAPGGQLLGIDTDPAAIEVARERLRPFGEACLLVNDNFINLQAICLKYNFFPVHGVLFDLGLSSLQIEGQGRGFSFQQDAPLDMRFSPAQKVTAADIVNGSPEATLADILRAYGEEPYSQRIARLIVRERPITSTLQLARLIERNIGRRGKIHPATRTFQALRIAVNNELDNLQTALKQAVEVLGHEGRLVVISYHSLEDRIVKQFLQRESRGCICPPGSPECTCHHVPALRPVYKKVIRPDTSEIGANPRSRSARMRAAARILTLDEADAVPRNDYFVDPGRKPTWHRPIILQKIKTIFFAS